MSGIKIFEPSRIGQMSIGGKVIGYAILIFWSVVVVFPMYWLLITAFKLPPDVNNGPTFLPWLDFVPSLHAWENILFRDADTTYGSYLNSIIISFLSTFIAIAVGSLAAYALVRITYQPRFGTIFLFVMCLLASIISVIVIDIEWYTSSVVGLVLFFFFVRALQRIKTESVIPKILLPLIIIALLGVLLFVDGVPKNVINYLIIILPIVIGVTVFLLIKGKLSNADILFWVISQRILPPIVVVLPIYIMFQKVGLLDTHFALVITYAVVNLPIVVWIMYDFMNKIPIDLEESAQLDGASKLRILWEVVMPLSKQGLAATTLLILILSWNEYLLAAFLSTSNSNTMPIMVAAQITQERGIYWWNMAVVIILMILPVIAMAFALQKFIIKGVLMGAVKG